VEEERGIDGDANEKEEKEESRDLPTMRMKAMSSPSNVGTSKLPTR
jgi:hypothetical protein